MNLPTSRAREGDAVAEAPRSWLHFGDTHTQRVYVGIWYILRAQRGSHIPTLRPKYIPYTMDPLG